MKKLFYVGIIGLILFEIANVYFIMPMPGSQRMRSIEVAYFLYSYRWAFRIIFAFAILLGFKQTFQSNRCLTLGSLAVLIGAIFTFNFQMAADHMFYQPTRVMMQTSKTNRIKQEKLVLGVVVGGEARAYPIQLIGYHHQVLDSIAGKPIMVTYCTVCRTGRVFEPKINSKYEKFRLVGMDHFNAMFEDETTKSWWRQANGEAIIGKLKGTQLPETFSEQMTLKQWLKLYPNSKILQPDSIYKEKYEKMDKYDAGKGSSDLTKKDSLSWKEKSWVVGIEINQVSKAFDWNRLKKERIINEVIGIKPIVLFLASDEKSYFAFERDSINQKFSFRNDSLITENIRYDLKGNSSDPKLKLKKIKAYQEFWHSWKTFHSNTSKY